MKRDKALKALEMWEVSIEMGMNTVEQNTHDISYHLQAEIVMESLRACGSHL